MTRRPPPEQDEGSARSSDLDEAASLDDEPGGEVEELPSIELDPELAKALEECVEHIEKTEGRRSRRRPADVEALEERVRELEDALERQTSKLDAMEGRLEQEVEARLLARARAQKAEEAREQAEERILRLNTFLERIRDRVTETEEGMLKVRRRAARDVEQARTFGAERAVKEILPVLDDLHLALAHAAGDPSQVMDGLRMVAELFRRTLARLGVRGVEADPGSMFDPACHEAMMKVPSTEQPQGAVLEVLRTGYTLNGRLLRAAQVSVAMAPPAPEQPVPLEEDDAAMGAATSQEE